LDGWRYFNILYLVFLVNRTTIPIDTSTMSSYMKTYATQPGQLSYNNAAFVSSFVGDGYPYRTLESQSGVKLFACPSWQPGSFINNAK
jgi:hypothetical protein